MWPFSPFDHPSMPTDGETEQVKEEDHIEKNTSPPKAASSRGVCVCDQQVDSVVAIQGRRNRSDCLEAGVQATLLLHNGTIDPPTHPTDNLPKRRALPKEVEVVF